MLEIIFAIILFNNLKKKKSKTLINYIIKLKFILLEIYWIELLKLVLNLTFFIFFKKEANKALLL